MGLIPRNRQIKDGGPASATPSLRGLGARLHAWAVAAARRPRLYAELGVLDGPQGRYEALTACVILLLERIGPSSPAGQAVFDTYIADLDGALREMGVGDLAMAKRMKGLGRNFYGRAKAWRAALAAYPDTAPLDALIGRTLAPNASAAQRAALAHDLIGLRETLARSDPLDPAFPPLAR